MKKTIYIILATAIAATLQAAVPLAWNVETTRAQPAAFDCYRGETLDLRASLYNAGTALDVSGTAANLYWQTNGMGDVYWSAPATVASNVLSATWAPTNDVGATSYNCFIGVAGEIYRAAFRLRMLPSPGAVPSELDLPAKSINFATVTVINPPYYTQGEVDSALAAAAQSATNYVNAVSAGKQDTISDLAAIREGAELGATALQSYTESDPVWTADKPSYATKTALGTVAQSATNYVNAVAAGKQDTISDLAAIRSGAALGATALQSYTETDPVWEAEKSGYATANSVSNLSTEVAAIPRITESTEMPGWAANAEFADTATRAYSADTAVSADYASSAGSANSADYASSAGSANSASSADYASSAGSANSASSADYASSADNASYAWSANSADTAAKLYDDSDADYHEGSYYASRSFVEVAVQDAAQSVAQSATNYTDSIASTLRDSISTKQDTISDLAAIRSGAALGATALQSYTESDPIWIADKPYFATRTEVAGKYTKPSTGIPETDLASSVQASLDKADTALQTYTETDPTVPAWATAASKPTYTYGEITGKPTLAAVATSNSYNDLDDTPDIPSSAADIGAASESDMTAAQTAIQNLQTESQVLYRLYSGSNVVCEVTNYNSVAHPPTMRLLQLDTNGVYITVWTETNGLSRTARAATNYTDSAVAAAEARAAATYAPRGWSATTSGLGADAPAETTWISTPTTVIAGGYEYQKAVTAGGTLWILASNGMTAATNKFGFLDISTADGTSVFRIEKTDSYLVGADPSSISVSGNTVTVGVPVVASDHPYLRYAASLTSPVTWYKEEDGNIPASVAYNWSGSSGGYVCTITTAAAQGFFCFEFLQPGSTKIINNGATDLSAGIIYNGTTYYPVVNGTKLEFVAQ